MRRQAEFHGMAESLAKQRPPSRSFSGPAGKPSLTGFLTRRPRPRASKLAAKHILQIPQSTHSPVQLQNFKTLTVRMNPRLDAQVLLRPLARPAEHF
jgi:hypothetical protein